MFRQLGLALPLLAFASGQMLPTDECPILGPSFPATFDLSRSKEIQEAIDSFPELIEPLFESGVINRTHSTIAIDVFSSATNKSIFSWYYAGSEMQDALSIGEINDGSIFRIGSVSKLFTVYAILVKAGIDVFNRPVTDYLPELIGNAQSDPVDKIRWEEVTVGALASHQAGSGGMPVEFSLCYVEPEGCSIEDFLAFMRDSKRPTYAPFQNAIYSDGGFGVLGRVLERLTGLPYNDAIQSVLSEPLGLNSSSTVEPPAEGLNAIALPGYFNVSAWGFDNQVVAPSGGVYSNCADLRALGNSILNSQLLSPAVTRKWMKPLAGTSSLTNNVGAPWEINRLTLPVSKGSNRTRVSDIYTKLGGNTGYYTSFVLSPDHGLGYSIHTGGPFSGVQRIPLRNFVGEIFVPAAELAAAENAAQNFVGVFVDDSAEGTNLTLTVDDDHPGLGLKSWYVNGTEWRANLTQPASPIPPQNLTVRLYPTGLNSESTSLSSLYSIKGSYRTSFRAVPQRTPIAPRTAVEGGKGLFESSCQSWTTLAFFPHDEFVFEIEDGKVKSVTSIFTNQTMTRLE